MLTNGTFCSLFRAKQQFRTEKNYGINSSIKKKKNKKNPEVDHIFKNRIKLKWILKCFGVFLASLTNKQFKNDNNLV